jgi:hypothetical protein
MLQGDAVSAQLSPHTAMDECCPLAGALKVPDVTGTLLQALCMFTKLMKLQLLTEAGLLLLPNIRAHCRADHLDATAVCCLALPIADCVMVSAPVTDNDEYQCHVYLHTTTKFWWWCCQHKQAI